MIALQIGIGLIKSFESLVAVQAAIYVQFSNSLTFDCSILSTFIVRVNQLFLVSTTQILKDFAIAHQEHVPPLDQK